MKEHNKKIENEQNKSDHFLGEWEGDQYKSDYDLNELKTDINNFLYTKLPEKTTLIKMENLGCKIHNLISDFITND